MLHSLHSSFKHGSKILNSTLGDIKIICIDGCFQYSKLLIAINQCNLRNTICPDFLLPLQESDALMFPEMKIVNLFDLLDSFFLEDVDLELSRNSEETFSEEIITDILVQVQGPGTESLQDKDTNPKETIDSFCFQCKHCLKNYSSEKKLYNHFYNVHHKKVKHTCRECLKQFSNPRDLSRHSQVHSPEKNFKCSFPGCASKFKRKSALNFHLKVNHSVNDEDNIFKCLHCGKVFYSPSNLKRHTKKCHS